MPILTDPSFYIYTVVAFFAGAAGAYWGTYVKKKAEFKATEEHFSSLQEHLVKTARDTEEIKGAVSRLTWKHQTQWAAREKLYIDLTTQLQLLQISIIDRCEHFLQPGSEYDTKIPESERYRKLSRDGSAALQKIRELQGPAAVYLESASTKLIQSLISQLWNAGEDAACTKDYVDAAHDIVEKTLKSVVRQAKRDLGLVEKE